MLSDPHLPAPHCGGLSAELFENELFGHSKGAFTGASGPSKGLIKKADDGTLFLDEVDSIPLVVQAKLLRFLQDHDYRPLGSEILQHANIRILAATNANLDRAVEAGLLRKDLLFRLKGIQIELPPLRSRNGDVNLLILAFVKKFAQKYSKGDISFHPAAMDKLCDYSWPGNVRELANMVERLIVMAPDHREIQLEEISLPVTVTSQHNLPYKEMKRKVLEDFTKRYFTDLLIAHGGNVDAVAKASSQHPRAVWRFIAKYQLQIRFGTKQSGHHISHS